MGLATLWRYGRVARAALKEETARGGKRRLNRDEREFQAAAIEILETPPSPTGRVLGLAVILSLLLALAWSFFGRLDVFAALDGRVVPVGQVKIIQPLVTGMVKAVHVHQGQDVAEGDLLIELDPTEQTADRARLEEDQATAQLAALRLRSGSARLAAAAMRARRGCRRLPRPGKGPGSAIRAAAPDAARLRLRAEQFCGRHRAESQGAEPDRGDRRRAAEAGQDHG